MRTKLRKGQIAIGSTQAHFPNGTSVEIDIYTQKDGGVYVTHYFKKKNGGTTAGETCFYCGGAKLGCITCPAGQSASGNCITHTLKCEPLTTTPETTKDKKR